MYFGQIREATRSKEGVASQVRERVDSARQSMEDRLAEYCALRENGGGSGGGGGGGGGASGDSEMGVDGGGQQFLKKIRGSVGSAGDSFSALALSPTRLAAAVLEGLCERPQLFPSRLPEFFTWLLRCGPEHRMPSPALPPALPPALHARRRLSFALPHRQGAHHARGARGAGGHRHQAPRGRRQQRGLG